MSCCRSKHLLALYVENDLPADGAEDTARHLEICVDCTRCVEQLRESQQRLRSLRREVASTAECSLMRRSVMAAIASGQARAGSLLRLERWMVVGLQRHAYVVAAAALLLAVASVGVVAQWRPLADPEARSPIPELGQTIQRPEGYREWPRLPSRAAAGVYVSPVGYREYARTGDLPDGTLMIWEALAPGGERARPHGRSLLLASVRDRARPTGWAFLDFTAADGSKASVARALPDSNGCGTCHGDESTVEHRLKRTAPVGASL